MFPGLKLKISHLIQHATFNANAQTIKLIVFFTLLLVFYDLFIP